MTERHALPTVVWPAPVPVPAAAPIRPTESAQLTPTRDAPGRGVPGLPERPARGAAPGRAEIRLTRVDMCLSAHTPPSWTPSASPAQPRSASPAAAAPELLVAGVKVATTQTPPIRSGRRVVNPHAGRTRPGRWDATFFEDAPGAVRRHRARAWLPLVRGELRRTGRRGVRCARPVPNTGLSCTRRGRGRGRSMTAWPRFGERMATVPAGVRRECDRAGKQRRVLVHSSGFRCLPASTSSHRRRRHRTGRTTAAGTAVQEPG